MDARSIGHEFVRQYYELLHNDPGQLHRFYLDSSTYIHADESQNDHPVIGQQAIYEAINRMNFSDCRTRIRQVDAQESLHKSFVVQVVGEISNAGQPMRPFVQTFILAESAENKFYVNNDMFRYQDHIIAPETNEPVISVPAVVPAAAVEQPITNGQVADYFSKPAESHAHLNGDVTVIDAPEPTEVVASVEEPIVHQPEPLPPVHTETEQEPVVEAEPSPEVKHETKAFSWASVAGSGSTSTQAVVKKPAPTRAPEQVKPMASSPTGLQQQPPQQQPQQQQQPASQRPQRRPNGNSNGASGSAPGARSGSGTRPTASIPDNQQIFVGGLNTSMTEDEIKGVFRDYGTAIDIRMTPKQFCFVAFESPQIVDNILAQAKEPGFYLRTMRLNVEEKKEKASSGRIQAGRQHTGGRGGRVGNGSSNSFSRGGSTANRSGRDAPPAGRR